MTRKIIDIVLLKSKFPELSAKRGRENRENENSGRANPKKAFLISALLGFLVVLTFFLVVDSKLFLKIRPFWEGLTIEESVEVNVDKTEIDFEKRTVPASFFEKDNKVKKEFETSGILKKEGKAGGKIKVYNNQASPVSLRDQTRFLSAEAGKVFKSVGKIQIPSASVKSGKTTPAFIEIEVVAQEGGESYNIGPSKFSIPGLVGTPLYYSVWAESEKALEGGFVKDARVISEKDVESAKDLLGKEIFDDSVALLKNNLPEGFVLLEQGVKEEEKGILCDGNSGEEAEKFSCEAEIKISAIAFKKSYLIDLAKFLGKLNISQEESLIESSFNFQFAKVQLSSEAKKLVFDLKIEANKYKNISIQKISTQIGGMTANEMEKFLKSTYPQIKEIKAEFSPFWALKSPKNQDNIEIELIFPAN